MKFLSFIFLFLTSVTFADTLKCAEKSSQALKEGRLQYSLIIKELSAINTPRLVGRDWDYARWVNVSVLSRNPKVGGRFTLDRDTFKGIARYADVNMVIEMPSQGVNVHVYLDEMDQTGVEIDGIDIRMNCHLEQE